MEASAADRIRAHLAAVDTLRSRARSAGLDAAVSTVKRLQAQRFRGTYADVLAHRAQGPAARFFLDELYGDHDFGQRDAQFGRIAGAIERLFPEAVAELSIDLAEMHALTETLDHTMATHWLELAPEQPAAKRYVQAWRATGRREARERQLGVVGHMGVELQRLTRNKSLLMMLKMMRRPAQAAGLSELQRFLEAGFAAFAQMGDARSFLSIIAERERRWIDTLFDAELSACAAALDAELCATGP
ncbi:FFLEELY motif protein [Hydrogenophaga pseudoflava]|uniref:FFLEELY motif protein n=1 Tax=Hydrogenophaga pseudoflava TaxID=47421 RepID=UPI0027E53869|nr:hypothetical protein [Hydrogenophaga pseudoflava]MDQ7743779.1 hypothetical protein [Hydrogenophaga pseudoflava]